MPKVLRKNIYLNDSELQLKRLDFSGLHPRLAYHLHAAAFHDDPYVIDGFGQSYRDIFKIVCLIALNADDRISAVRSIIKKLKDKKIGKFSYKQCSGFLSSFQNHHRQIEDYITSDFGIKAMFYDAKIITDCLRELMIKKKIIILTVHDEILCEEKYIDTVKEQMEKSYRKILKWALVNDKKLLKKDQPLPDNLKAIVDID